VVAFVIVIALLLALRIKGKVVANWLGVLFTYNQRARYYIFNKNDLYQRELYLPPAKKSEPESCLTKKVKATSTVVAKESCQTEKIH